jgi:alkanesulfonate monooxygenase SsuD/methylene tetrahydromethanopterin reductase-like flavin-dependent oxidoreductase (luciferase family)
MVRVGVVILPELRRGTAEVVWRRAEELGFDHAWTYDHLAWRTLRDSTWFGAVPTLTMAAMATGSIRLGTLVASPNFRHPVSFARELIALDDISQGRFTLGIGAGGTGWDTSMFGRQPWSRAERTQRFEEFVELTDLLLRNPASTTWAGRHYEAVDVPMQPGCVQRPRLPFAVAAAGPRGMRLAAAYGDTWVTIGDPAHRGPRLDAAAGAAVVARQVPRLEQVCHDIGRDPATVGRLVLTGLNLDSGLTSPEHFEDTVGHYEAVGVTDLVVHWPRPDEPFAADQATFERIFAG